MSRLTTAQSDRAAGVLLGLAAGDAVLLNPPILQRVVP